MDGDLSGRTVRERLAAAGEKKSGPAFYQFMARLEEAGCVEGWYDEKVIDGQRIKERCYRVTGSGTTAWNSVREFYLAHGGLRLQGV